MEQIVEHGQRDDNKQPDAQQKNRKDERHLERRKGGIKVEMLPGIGDKHLHRLVNRSTERHQQTEEKGIDAVDIIEVNHLQLLLHESTEQVGPDKEGENDDEIRSVSIAEKVDKLRNTIGGHEGAHQITVAHPPLDVLRVGQLHPYAVHAVLRMNGELCHDHPVTLVQTDIGILHRKIFQPDGVVQHLQIRVPGIMVPEKIS